MYLAALTSFGGQGDCGPPGCNDTPTFTDLQLWILLGLAAVTAFVIVATINSLLRQRRDDARGGESRRT